MDGFYSAINQCKRSAPNSEQLNKFHIKPPKAVALIAIE